MEVRGWLFLPMRDGSGHDILSWEGQVAGNSEAGIRVEGIQSFLHNGRVAIGCFHKNLSLPEPFAETLESTQLACQFRTLCGQIAMKAKVLSTQPTCNERQ